MIKQISATLVRLAICLLVTLNALASPAQADEPPRVLILPFSINAKEDLNYLKNQIPTVLGGHLEKQGARLALLDTGDAGISVSPGADRDTLMRLMQTYEAERVIWGSFTRLGNSFSLDVRLMDVAQHGSPAIFQAQGQSLENLLSVIKTISDQISHTLFKRKTITEIQIEGNQRIESDAILRAIQSRAGGSYRPSDISNDIRSIYAMGYFDDIRAEAQPDQEGERVVFHVKEKPTVRKIKIKGNKRFKDDEIKENLTITTGAILNIYKIRNNVQQIETLYKVKNYHGATVDYETHPLDNNQADLTFIIDEGPKLYVTEIVFEGNDAFSPKKLKKEINTSEKGFFYWLTSSGDLDRAVLDQDMAKLNAYYHNQGFIRARVGDPEIDILEEHIRITIKISEGPRFKVGRVDIDGDLITPKEDMLSQLSIGQTEYYSREIVRNDVLLLNDLYGNQGYAYVEVSPRTEELADQNRVNITYTIDKKEQVYIENIFIGGNTYTRDKVIRREMRIQEQELFNISGIKRSVRNLFRLDYFEDIKVNQLKGSSENKMSLKIDVVEKSTGNFTFGAGYSSEENVFLTGSIQKRNFLGYGQTLKFSGKFGSTTTEFVLNFTEPWLFDTPLTATLEAYSQTKEYDDEYDLKRNGGGIKFSYPVLDYTRLYWGYSIDWSEVKDITDKASQQIRELEGTNLTSSVNLAVGYDSRDRSFNTTEGSKHTLSLEYAGLGGDIGFTKYILESGWYVPLFKGLIGFARGKAGYVHEIDDGMLLPDYEKFYLGGINSIRGFDYRGIHLKDSEGSKIGAEFMIQLNVEITFPIAKEQGVMGVVFYDTGNVYEDGIDVGDMRQSVGYGIRWLSPFAPIRVEYGHKLDRRDDESPGRWEFTMGGNF